MIKSSLASVAALLVIAPCGSASTTAQGPTPSRVSVQPGDLPSGLHKCGLSNDIAAYLAKVKTADPTTYASIKKSWDDAQKKGAVAAYVAYYSDSSAHCALVQSNGSDVSTTNYRVVINFVIQFKDPATAAKGYTSESIFGFSAATLKGGGIPVIEGTNSGLGSNSVVVTVSFGNTSYYVAVWQKKAFMVIVAFLNVDPATAKKVAQAVNARIK